MWISVHRWQIPKDSASITLKFSAKVPTNSFPVKRKKEFYATVLPLMKQNFHRVYEDVAWFIEKYDYKNKDADWKDSKMPFSVACRNCVAATRPCLLMC